MVELLIDVSVQQRFINARLSTRAPSVSGAGVPQNRSDSLCSTAAPKPQFAIKASGPKIRYLHWFQLSLNMLDLQPRGFFKLSDLFRLASELCLVPLMNLLGDLVKQVESPQHRCLAGPRRTDDKDVNGLHGHFYYVLHLSRIN